MTLAARSMDGGPLQVRGKLKLDDGAVRALKADGRACCDRRFRATGEFERGEVVSCWTRRARNRTGPGQLQRDRDAQDPQSPSHESRPGCYVDEPN